MCQCGKQPGTCINDLCPYDLYTTIATLNISMKYAITIKRTTTVTAVAQYEEGMLHKLELPLGITKEQVNWLKQSIPGDEIDLNTWSRSASWIIVEQIPEDLTFNTFWEAYNYKVGKKERAIKLWLALSEADRTKALRSIPKYNWWLTKKQNMERLYPETYLNQRRFDNEFK